MNKAFIFLSLLCCAHFSLGQAMLGLEKRIVPIHAQNKTASKILLDLGKELGYSISYNADFLKESKITIESDTLTLGEVMDSLFIIKDLSFRLIGNQLVVFNSLDEQYLMDSCYQTITGRLIDGYTGQYLARASIRELVTSQLTVSNGEGVFRINVPCNQELMQLEIIAMGYRPRFIHQPINDELVTIILEGNYIPLKEVFILSVHPEQLMEEVLTHICDNYVNHPTKATSFFREAVIKNNRLVALSEAVFDVYNNTYVPSGRLDQVQLVKGRKFIDHSNIDTIDFKVKGSLKSCFELDVVKHQPSFFNLESYKENYNYSFKTMVEYNGRDIYVIDFKKKDLGGEELPYEGSMYIDKENKTLISIDFEINKRTLRNTEKYFVVKKSKNIKTSLQKARYYVHYTDVEGKLAMNYAYFKNEFKVKKKNSLFSAKYEAISEYVVNRFQIEDVNRFKNRDTFSADQIFMEQPMEYSDSYWNGINFLPIETPLIESSEQLQQILSAN